MFYYLYSESQSSFNMDLKLNLEYIKTDCPKSWNDFSDFYKTGFGGNPILTNVDFGNIPFEMQLGIFLRYFNENSIELDICNSVYQNWPTIITEAFKAYENVISHYS